MPDQPPRGKTTPGRSLRIPDPLWKSAKETAAARGETVTDVVIRALDRYVKRYKRRGGDRLPDEQ